MRGGRGGHMRTSVRLLTVIVLATLGTIGAAHATAAQTGPAVGGWATYQWTSTLAEQLNEPVLLYRGFGYALTALGLVALLLACTGIHALVSLSVSERKRELAVRLALGAGHGRLAREVLARAASQLVTGCLAGTLIAYGVHRAVMLTPFDLDTSGPWSLTHTVPNRSARDMRIARPTSRVHTLAARP